MRPCSLRVVCLAIGAHCHVANQKHPWGTPRQERPNMAEPEGVGALQDHQPARPVLSRQRSARQLWRLAMSAARVAGMLQHFSSVIPKLEAEAGDKSSLSSSDEAINVVVRVRPLNDREQGQDQLVRPSAQQSEIEVLASAANEKPKRFTFDRVLGPESTQADVFQSMKVPMAKFFAGFNVCVFAYGQTGSGKTWTMLGSQTEEPELAGVAPRAIAQLFKFVDKHSAETRAEVFVSVLEIYNETLKDLLASRGSTAKLEIREDRLLGVVVRNLTLTEVTSAESVGLILDRAMAARAVGETSMNLRSSRSHMIFTLTLHQQDRQDLAGYTKKVSRLNLVDLAGSERAKSTGATGDRLKEGASINQSLSHLGNVINALVKTAQGGGNGHIPFRSSKLTRLLQPSLGGNSSTLMIANCSPAEDSVSETVSTLRFANRAKQVQNKAKVNFSPQSQAILDLTGANLQLKAKVKSLEHNLEVERCRRYLQSVDSGSESKLAGRIRQLEAKASAEATRAAQLEQCLQTQGEATLRLLASAEDVQDDDAADAAPPAAGSFADAAVDLLEDHLTAAGAARDGVVTSVEQPSGAGDQALSSGRASAGLRDGLSAIQQAASHRESIASAGLSSRTELRALIAAMDDERESLLEYIDNLLAVVMDRCPDVLEHR
eukprot:m.329352 g.329352  ORF g.329352 m.329352 type:complete len:662 (-) comp19757_c0_seq19:57-2042(-)